MTDPHELSKRMRNLIYAWISLCGFLVGFIIALLQDNTHLRDKLAKPVPITQQQEHQVIKEYLQTMTGETRYALRKQIGCTDKE